MPLPAPIPDELAPLARLDASDDALFYAPPRLVHHIDDAAIAAVTALYRERLPAGGRILDLMSSWVSHLPTDVDYAEVVGLGMNGTELACNPRLARHVVQDLNRDWRLPFDDAAFDAVTICVSIDYLTRPATVLAECGRVARADGVLAITFSNRCFPTKVVEPWLRMNDRERVGFVSERVARAGVWTAIERLDRSPPHGDPLYAVLASRAPD